MKRTPLKRVSSKHAKELREYRKLKAAFLSERVFCEYPVEWNSCFNRATDIHHANGRTGYRLNDTRYWWALCRNHHDYLHQHPKEARELGILI